MYKLKNIFQSFLLLLYPGPLQRDNRCPQFSCAWSGYVPCIYSMYVICFSCDNAFPAKHSLDFLCIGAEIYLVLPRALSWGSPEIY